MKTLLKYDFIYLKRTSKFIIFPALALFFAITSPLLTKYMGEILQFLLGTEDNLAPLLGDTTSTGSYVQYVGNLFELFLIVSIFTGVSMFMTQKNKGELPLVLSKPVNRTKYLLSKMVSFIGLISVTLTVSGVVFSYYTFILFNEVDIVLTLNITLLFILYNAFILSIALFTSVFMKSYAGASIVTFLFYLGFSILGAFNNGLLDYLPGRINVRIGELIYGNQSLDTLLPTILIIISLTWIISFLGIQKFRTYDL